MKIRPSCSRIAFGDYLKENINNRSKGGTKVGNKGGAKGVATGGVCSDKDCEYNIQGRRTIESSVGRKNCDSCRSSCAGKLQESRSACNQSQRGLEATGCCHCRGDRTGRPSAKYGIPRQENIRCDNREQSRVTNRHLEETQSVHSNMGDGRRSRMSERKRPSSKPRTEDPDNISNYRHFENERKCTVHERSRQYSKPRAQDLDNISNYSQPGRKSRARKRSRQSRKSRPEDPDTLSKDSNFENERNNTCCDCEGNTQSSKSRCENVDNLSNYVNTEKERTSRVRKASNRSSSPKSRYTENRNNYSNSGNSRTSRSTSIQCSDTKSQNPQAARNEDEKQSKIDQINVIEKSTNNADNKNESIIPSNKEKDTECVESTICDNPDKVEEERKLTYLKNPPKNTNNSLCHEELLKTMSIDSIETL